MPEFFGTPCATVTDCEHALGIAGTSQCFTNLKPSNTNNDVNIIGGCACSNQFGLGGPQCLTQTSATSITALLYGLAMTWFVLVMLRFAPVLYYNITLRLFKVNAAGVTFIFAWISVINFFIECALTVASVTTSGGVITLAAARQGFSRTGIIFLTCAVLNMTTAFIEMSQSTRVIANVEKHRNFLIITVISLSVAVTVSLFLAPSIVTTLLGLLIVGGLSIAGLVGPAVLYVRSARNLVVGKELKTSSLLYAMFMDATCGSQHMLKLLGFSQSGSTNSRDAAAAAMAPTASPNTSKDSSKMFNHTAMSSVGLGGGGSSVELSRSRNGSKENLLNDDSDQGSMSDSRRGSKDETESVPMPDHTPTNNAHAHRSMMNRLYVSSKGSIHIAGHAREAKMISFLSRTLKMGVNVSVCLILWLILVGSDVYIGALYDGNTTYMTASLFLCIEYFFVAGSFYAILKYLEHQYVSAHRKLLLKKAAVGHAAVAGTKDSKESKESKLGSDADHSREVKTSKPEDGVMVVHNPVYQAERTSVTAFT